MFEDLLRRVDPTILHRSGSVFYSGRSAFERPNDLYILGLNPGGSPVDQADETIERHIDEAIHGPADWSAYQDESWLGKAPGTHGMQPRVLHLLRSLGRAPREVPASNVVFVRSSREVDLRREKQTLLASCWPVHEAVIRELAVQTVICFGGTAGAWVRDAVNAHDLVGTFVETNERRWTNYGHRNRNGLSVVTLTHPSIVNWRAVATDPTPLVRTIMAA